MKSSGASVFTRHNPFPRDPPLPKSHYSPSRSKKIPKQQKRLALSPVRFTRPSISPEPPSQSSPQKTEEHIFHDRSHGVLLCPPTSTGCQLSFSESWPSTDLSQSTVNSAASPCSEDQIYPTRTMVSTETPEPKEPSVLAKYIERFRFGKPQSREERQREAVDGEDDELFWWMSTSPPSSSMLTQTSERPTRETHELNDGPHSFISGSPVRDSLNLSMLTLSELSHCEPEEPEILQLQERAKHLLQKSEQSFSSGSVPVSSGGLGCSDFSSPVSTDEPVRKPVVPILMGSTNLDLHPSLCEGTSFHTPAVGSVGSGLPREDDILFQWRLRRKMEQARQSNHNSLLHVSLAHTTHHSHFNTTPLQRSHLTFTPVNIASLDLPTPDAVLPSSSRSISRLQPEATIQPQEQPDLHSQPANLNQRVTGTTSALPKHHRQINMAENREDHNPGQKPSSTNSQISGEREERTEDHWPDPERRKVTAVKREIENKRSEKMKKSERVERRIGPVRARQTRGHEGVSRKEGQRSTRVKRSGDGPPPSPIHNALGQVVSEVLFPVDSPTQCQTPSSSVSPAFTPPPPPQSPVATPPAVPQPCEVIGQLMQDAEDSDGKEFEDDPLLQVLRQQRNWVKEQLCEVDTMIEGFLPLTPTDTSNI